MKKILGLFFMLTTCIFAREVTLEEAIQLSVDNSKGIKISEKDVQASKIKVSMAFKNALPSVTYEGTYTHGESEREMYGKDWKEVDDKDGYSQSFTISQPIFHGGAIVNNIINSRIERDISELIFLGEKRDIRLETIQNYSNIVKYNKDLSVLFSSKKELEEDYKRQKEKLKLRLITKTDMLKTEYSILDIETQITQIQNAIAIEKENLRIKTGIPKAEEIEVVEFDVPKYLSKNIDFNKDMEQALNESINALIAEKNVESAEANKKIARADMLPQVNAFASYGTYTENSKYDATIEDGEWRGGIKISWNIFEFGKNYDNYKVSSISEQQEMLREEDTKDNIDVDVKEAYLELIRMEKDRDSKERAMEAAIENFRMDHARYNEGLISTVDYLLSETQMRDAKVNYNQVVIDYLYAFEKYRSLLI